MERSFEDIPTDLVVKFNDASNGYVEAERLVSAGSDGAILFDVEGDGEKQEIEAFGVTSADVRNNQQGRNPHRRAPAGAPGLQRGVQS